MAKCKKLNENYLHKLHKSTQRGNSYSTEQILHITSYYIYYTVFIIYYIYYIFPNNYFQVNCLILYHNFNQQTVERRWIMMLISSWFLLINHSLAVRNIQRAHSQTFTSTGGTAPICRTVPPSLPHLSFCIFRFHGSATKPTSLDPIFIERCPRGTQEH